MALWPFRRRAQAGASAPPVPLVLYTRAGCGLCEEMEAVIEAARLPFPFALERVDIARDPALLEAHGRSIPVLTIAGRTAFKGRMERSAFERKFARLAREAGW